MNKSDFASNISTKEHKRIKSVLSVLDAEEIDEAFKKVQEKVQATTPKADVPFAQYGKK